jgi:hypothetical protein
VRQRHSAWWVRGRVVASPPSAMYRTMRQGAEIRVASLMSGSRDINRDAKSRRLAMNEGPGGDIGASPAAWRCQRML